MIIQVILTVGLLSCLLYALLQRQRSRFISLAIAVAALVGIYFVLVPESTSRLALLVGVGRGTDLILYCWLVISLMVSISLHFKILRLQSAITELAREIALQAAPGTTEDRGVRR
jgi:hypothetical protein